MDKYILSNGVEIPGIGFGTWRIPGGEDSFKATMEAIEEGYRHIDTAALYETEESVGRAVRTCGLPREELFVTSKVWLDDRGYDKAMRACEASLKALDIDHIDLYLIHWPSYTQYDADWRAVNNGTWRALEHFHKQGLFRAIGVCNCMPHHIESIMESCEVKPMVNQIEFHPCYPQLAAAEFCHRNNILVEAWRPLGKGLILDMPQLKAIADRHGKTAAQVCMRWCMQHGTLPIVKTTHKERMISNMDVHDFELSAEEMAYIDTFPPISWSGQHPDFINLSGKTARS